MSIFIKGMEMPRTHPITVEIYPDGTVLSKTVGRMDIHGKTVPIPLHGDLKDRDYLKQTHCAERTLYHGNCLVKSGEECDWESITFKHVPGCYSGRG